MSISNYPTVIFIVPYRNREQQKAFFERHMKYIMEDFPQYYYEIYYVHQLDSREFNRGAMKNIGFLTMKQKYPNHYKNITFVFNDIDCCPFTKNFLNYETKQRSVKHFYGFTHTLGGIVSINGEDFENVGGFPNFFGYGYEDNMLQHRVITAGLNIDRSVFYHLYDPNILSFRDGVIRNINSTDYELYMKKTTEGINSFRNINYRIDNEFIQVDTFDCGRTENITTKSKYDLRNGNNIFSNQNKNKGRINKKSNMTMIIPLQECKNNIIKRKPIIKMNL